MTFEHSSVNGRCAAVASSPRTDPDIARFNRSSRSRPDAVTAFGAVVRRRRDAEREPGWICCRGLPLNCIHAWALEAGVAAVALKFAGRRH
ncbi:hypothetical protein ACVWXO_011099 [Bradyrhizobium sp. LM2.7]